MIKYVVNIGMVIIDAKIGVATGFQQRFKATDKPHFGVVSRSGLNCEKFAWHQH